MGLYMISVKRSGTVREPTVKVASVSALQLVPASRRALTTIVWPRLTGPL